MCRNDHAVVYMGLTLHGLVAAKKYTRNFSGINKRTLVDLDLRTQWQLGGNSVKVIVSNPLEMVYLVELLCRIN